jgi:hypothetical protein
VTVIIGEPKLAKRKMELFLLFLLGFIAGALAMLGLPALIGKLNQLDLDAIITRGR